jgi:cyclophilin family peptidyl-prolyl cis-trans isomerase
LLAAALWLTSGVLFAAEAEPAAAPSEKAPAKTEQPKSEAPEPGPAAAEYQKLLADWKTLLAELRTLQAKYKTAKKEDRDEIVKQWDALIAKGDAAEPQFLAAAEKAFVEAPNADKELRDLLLSAVVQNAWEDNYEEAFRLGKVLAENKCDDKRVEAVAGTAALMVGDYESAEKYLLAARKNKVSITTVFPKDREGLDVLVGDFLRDPAAWKKAWAAEQKIREAEAKVDDLPRVLLKTSKGDIEIELFENEAPNTVASFVSLVEKKFYDGLTFHRVLRGFMAQGGDPKGDGSGGPGYTIACECRQPNHRLHFRGSLSMAHAGPDTGGSQFFLTFLPTKSLDGKHTVFGRVVKGFDVLSKLKQRDPDGATAGVEPDKIVKATVIRKREHEYVPKTGADK